MRSLKSILLVCLMLFGAALPSVAQASPTAAVEAYWAARPGFTSLDEFLPFVTTAVKDIVAGLNAEQKAAFLKEVLGEPAEATVVSEAITGESATIVLASAGLSGKATAKLEGGVWKLASVNWTAK